MIFDIAFVKVSELSAIQLTNLTELDQECFGDVPAQAIAEDFIAEPFGYLFAMLGEQMISRLALYKREVSFAGQPIILGGMGGVCVTTDHRHHGVASSMLKRGLLILRDEHCDVCCLNVDLERRVYGVYEKLGFKMMPREISFENIRGEIVRDHGTMFVPLCSPEKYDLIMNSPITFHYGRGYW